MFEPITNLPNGVIGFEAVGKIEATDYEDILMPALARGAAAEACVSSSSSVIASLAIHRAR